MNGKQKKIKEENAITYRTTSDAVIYIHVCVDQPVLDARGLKPQEAACRELCAQRGWTVLHVFVDIGPSRLKAVERPGVQKMMKFIEKNKNVNLVVFAHSCFGNLLYHTLEFIVKMDSKVSISFRPVSPLSTAAQRMAG